MGMLEAVGLLPRTSLEGVELPARVKLRGRVVCEAPLVSPITSLRGAILVWEFFAQLLAGKGSPRFIEGAFRVALFESFQSVGNDSIGSNIFERLATLREAPAFLLIALDDGALVRVPTEGLELHFSGDTMPDELAGRSLPPSCAHVEKMADKGALFFYERRLMSGDQVQLRATVTAVAGGDQDSPYRASAEAPDVPPAAFEARPDLGPVLLYDESLQGVIPEQK